MTAKSIYKNFPLTNAEYEVLEQKFGDLCRFASWQLRRNNVKNNPGVDLDDFIQDLRMALLNAGCYYKRQVYIESCFKAVEQYAHDSFTEQIVRELKRLWKQRKRHGANRQKFGDHQERLLTRIVRQCVPRHLWPRKNKPLEIDSRFITYCKSITWNKKKSLGKKISRERSFRSGLVSLSDWDFLAGDKGCGMCLQVA